MTEQRKHKIKCTLFGELVDQVLPHLERDDGEPFIMVVQLFKSNIYLNSVNIQSTYYVSTCYFNPNIPEVIDFKKSLATDFVPCSQRISQLEAQPQYSVRDEISAGIVPVRTIEEVLNITETCPKKVVQSKDRYWCDNCRRVGFKVMLRYRLQLIVTDGSGCLNLIVWNKEAEQMIGKAAEKVKELSKCDKGDSYPKYLENMIDKRFLFKLNITYKNINSVEGVYSVTKLSDDESLMSSYGVPNSSSDASMLPNIPIAETDEDSNGHAAVSLSKDSAVESNCDSSCQTPAKRTSSDAVDDSPATAALSPDVQASANKTFKRNCGRKKID
ncbi:Replication protein A 70 kDa DNA-binding subunit D [Arachis hypogaea]|nr:Replication protein A 70 kDa DNA-binding subunit D [Arachis hypogaea]